MRRLTYGLVFWLFLWAPNTGVYGQLEKVEAYYKQLKKESKPEPVTLRFVQANNNLVEDYAQLSQIILIRHGEPALEKRGWKERGEAMQYIKDYDSVGVYPPSFIPLEIQPGELTVIHTSNVNRAVSTAEQVFEQKELFRPDTMFREFERKIFSFLNIRVPIKFWLAGSRVLWFMGVNDRGIESSAEARNRAQQAAAFLEQDALQHGKSLLVSHGLLNRYLEKYLNQRGWKTVYDGGNGYLSQKMLVRYGPATPDPE